MSELKPCQMTTDEAIGALRGLKMMVGMVAKEALDIAISALRRAQPDNAPIALEVQWTETASDNTDYVLAYADGIYCVTNAEGRVMCEFLRRKPEPEGGEG